MGRYNDLQLLGVTEQDDIDISLDEPTNIDFPASTTIPITTIAVFTPVPIFIRKIDCMFGDIVITDPGNDLYLGWAVFAATNGGTAPTFASVQGFTANVDLPLITEDGVDVATAVAPAVNTPFDLMQFVGSTGGTAGASGDSFRADGTPNGGADPIRVAGPWFQVRLATYLDGSLTDTVGLDNVALFIYGTRVGSPD